MRHIAALLLAALLSPAAWARGPELPKPTEKWVTVRADEFRFVSNVSADETLKIARDIMRMRAALGKVTRLEVRSALPTTVFIFAGERAFAGYRDAVVRHQNDLASGLFVAGESGNFILLRSDLEEVDRSVYHELTHYFVRNTTGPLPLWIREGIAEYYSTFRTSGNDVYIGRPIPEHVLWLRATSMMPLAELFATTRESPVYNERMRRGVFYAQSWALFHYLMNEGRAVQFGRFVQLLQSGRSVDEAFGSAFAMKHSALEQELRKYVRRNAFTYARHSLEELPAVELPKPEPMSHSDILAAFGHLLAHSDEANAAVAEPYLRAAIAADPRNALAHADLGRLHDRAGRTAESDAAYRTAAEVGSDDADVYLFAGLGLVKRHTGKRSRDIPAADRARARALLQRSTELDPSLALAWAGLGMTYLGEPDPAPGITALEKSLELAPGNEHAAFHLLQLYANAGRSDDARRIFEGALAHSSDPKLTQFAEQALEWAEVGQLEKLTEQRRHAEARALATSLLARTTNESVKGVLNDFMQGLDGAAAADAINRAVTHANAGNYAEALQLLDETLPGIADPEMLEHAKKFREELAAQAAKRKRQ